MDRVRTTGAFLGTTSVYNAHADGSHTFMGGFDNFWDRGIGPLLSTGSSRYVFPEPMHLSELDITLDRNLGEGGFGQAWTCTLARGGRYVIKLPRDTSLVHTADGRRHFISLQPPSLKEAKENIRDFQEEIFNFECMMEPGAYIANFADGEHWPSTLHLLPPEANQGKYREYAEEMKRIKTMPGYAHMHQLYHFAILCDGRLPVILSMPCDGSLENYIDMVESMRDDHSLRAHTQRGPSDLWLSLGSQLALAMEFMEGRNFVNVDIKMDNILYHVVLDEEGTQHMHFLLADYGMCTTADYRPCDVTLEEELPRGLKSFAPANAQNNVLDSASLAKHQIATVLEFAVDRRGIRKLSVSPYIFEYTLPPTLIMGNVYFDQIFAIRSARNGQEIASYFKQLANILLH